jgi:GrpB-like predicted nucleotidyltransferase (UPF0157 family)
MRQCASDDANRLARYDDAWPKKFAEERCRLVAAFSGLVRSIEHIGSTAVPGLAAKPTIDILICVGSQRDLDRVIQPLRALGYEYAPEWEQQFPHRRYFRKGSPPIRDCHVHVAIEGSDYQERQRLFRDVLRSEPVVATAYERLKRSAAREAKGNRRRYTRAKSAFVEAIIESESAAHRARIAKAHGAPDSVSSGPRPSRTRLPDLLTQDGHAPVQDRRPRGP